MPFYCYWSLNNRLYFDVPKFFSLSYSIICNQPLPIHLETPNLPLRQSIKTSLIESQLHKIYPGLPIMIKAYKNFNLICRVFKSCNLPVHAKKDTVLFTCQIYTNLLLASLPIVKDNQPLKKSNEIYSKYYTINYKQRLLKLNMQPLMYVPA